MLAASTPRKRTAAAPGSSELLPTPLPLTPSASCSSWSSASSVSSVEASPSPPSRASSPSLRAQRAATGPRTRQRPATFRERMTQPDIVVSAGADGAGPLLRARALSDSHAAKTSPKRELVTVFARAEGAKEPAEGSGALVRGTEPAPEPPAPADAARARTFALIYGAYVAMLVSRKNYGFWLPHAMETLGRSKSDVAAIGSSYEMMGGAGALLNGFVIDAMDPALGLAWALGLSGAVNAALCVTPNLSLMAALWGFNGAVQSVGWPCVSKIFLAAFPDPKVRAPRPPSAPAVCARRGRR